jgi:type IV secretory pathway VirB10-like protein
MPIAPPQGLPPPQRQIRALRRTAQYIAAGVSVVIIGIVYYGLTHMGPSGSDSSQTTNASTDSAAADVLRNAPNGTEIPARRHVVPVAAKAPMQFNLNPQAPATSPAQETASTAATAPAAPDDDMSDAAIAGRKAAWQGYYQALSEQQQHRLAAKREAMAADMDVAPPAPTGPVAGGGSSAPAPDKQPTDFFSAHASNPSTDYSPFTLTDPISPYELKATDVITAKLVSAVNSDSPGIIKGLVTKNVLDHATGMHILVPQGSTLEGVYDTTVAYGQTRIVTAWTRILYPPPCDQSLDLGAMPGSDQSGQAGFEDLTDNHLGKIFTSAILVSVFSAGAQLSQPQQSAFSTYSPMQTAAGTVGQQTSQLGVEFARRGLSIPPTERVRNGYNFSIMLTKDVAFTHDWQPGVCGYVRVASR